MNTLVLLNIVTKTLFYVHFKRTNSNTETGAIGSRLKLVQPFYQHLLCQYTQSVAPIIR